jgi:hypothetical protein
LTIVLTFKSYYRDVLNEGKPLKQFQEAEGHKCAADVEQRSRYMSLNLNFLQFLQLLLTSKNSCTGHVHFLLLIKIDCVVLRVCEVVSKRAPAPMGRLIHA